MNLSLEAPAVHGIAANLAAPFCVTVCPEPFVHDEATFPAVLKRFCPGRTAADVK